MGVDPTVRKCEIGYRRNYHEGLQDTMLTKLQDTMLTKPPVPYDFCVCVPISSLLIVRSTPV